jgi:hypothetical protein
LFVCLLLCCSFILSLSESMWVELLLLTICTNTASSTNLVCSMYYVVIGCFLFWNRLMGKVASDKCHKWVFKEPTECEPNISNYWQSSFDAVCIFISLPTPITPLLLLSHLSLSLSPSVYLESYRV